MQAQTREYRSWSEELRARAARSRTPVSATLELTARCNLRCRHCYLGNRPEHNGAGGCERDTEATLRSLEEWAQAGVLYLLITGGEPMLRPDFEVLYRQARELGMLVTVFCNGTLVDDRIVELFRELPPRRVEIGVYGATEAVYESVTRAPGSYERAWRGIRRLQRGGIPSALKTVLMTLNVHELDAMEAQARELGFGFRYDAAIFPCLPAPHAAGADGETPLELRVPPETVAALDTATPERRRMWRNKIEEAAGAPEGDRLYACAAGATGFYADSQGRLSPCLLTAQYRCEPEGRPFRDVWAGELAALRQRKKTRSGSSASGGLRGACTTCPAMNFLETGDEEKESDYMRKTIEERYRAVMHAM